MKYKDFKSELYERHKACMKKSLGRTLLKNTEDFFAWFKASFVKARYSKELFNEMDFQILEFFSYNPFGTGVEISIIITKPGNPFEFFITCHQKDAHNFLSGFEVHELLSGDMYSDATFVQEMKSGNQETIQNLRLQIINYYSGNNELP